MIVYERKRNEIQGVSVYRGPIAAHYDERTERVIIPVKTQGKISHYLSLSLEEANGLIGDLEAACAHGERHAEARAA